MADTAAAERPDVLVCALDARDPYTNDRDYPQPEDWADGANPFARPHPELPWVHRGLPGSSMCPGSITEGTVIVTGHRKTVHHFPEPEPAGRTRTRRHVAVDRPERIA